MNPYLLAVFICLLYACSPTPAEQAPSSISRIQQAGTPYERGVLHGTSIKTEVVAQVQTWEAAMQEHLKLDLDSMYAIVTQHTSFMEAINREAKELLDEVNGIADGAGLDRKLLLCYNLGEEIYSYCTANFEQCSNIAISGKTRNTMAYNQDLPLFLHGQKKPVLLEFESHVVFSMPGSIGLSGASTDFVVSCNSLPMLKMNRSGLPLSFCLRKLLEKQSLEEAIRFLEDTPLAIPQNLMIANPDTILNLECSNAGLVGLSLGPTKAVIHTNHPIKNTDLKRAMDPSFVCPRYHYLDSIQLVLPEVDEAVHKIYLTQVCNQFPILNHETFLRFTAQYPTSGAVEILFVNPASGEEITLFF